MKLKKGDTVEVITGKDKDKQGEISQVFPKAGKVLISGVNVLKKHQKQQGQKQGGIVQKEAPILASKVMYFDGTQKTRIGYRFEKGKKVRYAKKTGKVID